MADLRDQLQATLGDNYTLEGELGGGGMSRVFVATDKSLERQIVVKVLPPELAGGLNVQRFRREILLAARLQHPHIVPVLSAGETDGLPYFTMPFVEGQSLRARLAREGELPVNDAVRILRDVASALAYAHEHGVVHRDIKPDNVLLSGGSATVTDFGVAKALSASAVASGDGLTSLGVAIGTPAYMAPEQAVADPSTDHRADIYSLGAMGYEMLTGQPPFAGRPAQATLAAHAMTPPEPVASRRPTVPEALSDFIGCCLEKRPADRPQSAAEVVRLLDGISTSGSGEHRPKVTPAAPAPIATGRRRGRTRTVNHIIGVVALLGVAWVLWGITHRPPERVAATERPMVAVLPFENVGSPGDEYFAEGISEEITSRLSRIDGVNVIARGSAAQYRGSRKSLRDIARELNASYLLTGTVRWDKTGGVSRVRVSPELVRAADQRSLWSEPFEAVLADVFRVQASVAERVAAALDVRLRPQDRTAIASPPTKNLEAYDCYLRGKAVMARGTFATTAGRAQASRALRCAVEKDPGFALAHAALAVVETARRANADDLSPKNLELIKREALRAVELDPRTPETYLALQRFHQLVGDRAAASRDLEKAIGISPEHPEALLAVARSQARRGDLDAAIATYRRVEMLDPRSMDAVRELSIAYEHKRDYPMALRARERLISIDPEHARAYNASSRILLSWRGDTASARREIERGLKAAGVERFLVSASGVASWIAYPPALLDAYDSVSTRGMEQSRVEFYVLKSNLYRFRGNTVRSRAYADSTIQTLARTLQSDRENIVYHQAVSGAYAQIGRKSEAIAAADRAVEIATRNGDVLGLGSALGSRANVYTILGEYDAAVSDLERALRMPSLYSAVGLTVDWRFAPLKSNARFRKLVGIS